MRYETFEDKLRKVGQTRVRRGFLWLPKAGRWLEGASWVERFARKGLRWEFSEWLPNDHCREVFK